MNIGDGVLFYRKAILKNDQAHLQGQHVQLMFSLPIWRSRCPMQPGGHRASIRLRTGSRRAVSMSWSWQSEECPFRRTASLIMRGPLDGLYTTTFSGQPNGCRPAWSTCHFHGNGRWACSTVEHFPFSMFSLVAYRS